MEQFNDFKLLELSSTENGCSLRVSGSYGSEMYLDDVEVQLTGDGLHIVSGVFDSSQEKEGLERAMTAAVCGKFIERQLQNSWELLRPLADNVRNQMSRLGLSTEDLATQSGIPLAHLSDLLEGTQEFHYTISVEDIRKLSKVFGLLPEQLLNSLSGC